MFQSGPLRTPLLVAAAIVEGSILVPRTDCSELLLASPQPTKEQLGVSCGMGARVCGGYVVGQWRGASHLLIPAPSSLQLIGLAVSLEEVGGNSKSVKALWKPLPPPSFPSKALYLPAVQLLGWELHLLSHSSRRAIRDLRREDLTLGRRGEKRAGEGTGEKLMSHSSDSMEVQAIALLV